jgi:dTDP-4-dehydrorhamnose reductase
MMRILLLGKNGQLGWELNRVLAPLGDLVTLDYPEIDLSAPENIRAKALEIRPEVIVNATAYTAVDRAESEPDIALAANAHAPGRLAETACELGAALIHYSTDYVFDGMQGIPYTETDRPNPLNIYGQSKLAGEQAIAAVGGAYLILRTSWVYSLRRDSFVTKVLGWGRQHPTLRIVEDQVSNPTWARMLAEVTGQLLAMGGSTGGPHIVSWIGERSGLYHLAGSGQASRLEWAEVILRLDPRRAEQVCQALQPALTRDFPTPAQRPLYSALNCDRFSATFGLRLPAWQTALELALQT